MGISLASLPQTSVEPAMSQDTAIDVTVETMRDIARLETIWTELEARASHSFYLSWLWIGTWLRHLPRGAQPHVLVARTSSRTVGLAIICRRKTWSFGLHARARWLLNETGDVRFDRLFIEYNNILAERSLADATRLACLEALAHHLRHSDQLVLSGIDPDFELAACRTAGRAGLLADVRADDMARWIDFAKVRQKGGNFRATLGRNTRQAVSRAMRLYAERGPISFRTMEATSEALAAFDLLAELHQVRWGRKGAFAHPSFRRFHEELIARGVPTGAVRISRTLAGDQTIGILYNFVHDGRVYNYQSGFLYERDGRLKPGLVSHVLAIEDSIGRGECGYDFLAGFSGHKSRLANAEHPLKWIAIGRDGPERRIEAKLRGARRVLGTVATNMKERLFEAQRVSGSTRYQSTCSRDRLSNLCFSVAELVDAPHS
ncbi:GNAT family N-acetyltransferase [Mesorhizobium sp. M4B.F.Ca.ET.215.01.1.1]|nr:GNAT family N-acetyltransferase [Mesorhizobium sp. M4B.F.Ca.ET.013.02.1.1]RUW70607.1 GNAT family N-acetyltransferase [Mesorhizobium sp. M4B.F.Ca.ET.049.02.1.2]RVD46467.1 GNAT family N-acetyltransferase [Mesorhizobium sp. M4B.F.Ca.ET.019.03.1.1]RWF66607.1 MAG: GNAT family N-acetyltransferase [Mesorhizobium sp.]RWX70979.1 GNAT family N-acetyltransferase [Mesorhizobium sp. M4B.F.Ca.ET.089.01.1.1]TGQ18960.1 GNAT family N-acetyltransferase [Mesorhizobium sp. M4B.F.Ca.ET.215.01.1.1]TGQ40572.1 GN